MYGCLAMMIRPRMARRSRTTSMNAADSSTGSKRSRPGAPVSQNRRLHLRTGYPDLVVTTTSFNPPSFTLAGVRLRGFTRRERGSRNANLLL